MKRRIVLAFFVFFLGINADAKILRVNNTPNVEAGYTSLENALIDATEGDTIYLEPSSQPYGKRDAYGFNDIKITKSVNIIGPGFYLAENKVTDYAAGESFIGGVVHLSAERISVSGIVLGSLRIEANDITVQRCQILSGNSTSIRIARDVNGSVIEQCFIVGDITGQNYPRNIMIGNNIICGSVMGFERSRIEHNTFGNYTRYGTVRDLKFSTVIENIMENQGKSNNNTTAFVNNYVGSYTEYMTKADFKLDGNYKMKPDSPVATKSSDGTELGAFGGALPYVVSGLPDMPVIRNIVGPTSVNAQQGMRVTVKYRLER